MSNEPIGIPGSGLSQRQTDNQGDSYLGWAVGSERI